jgi:hypothetical protein
VPLLPLLEPILPRGVGSAEEVEVVAGMDEVVDTDVVAVGNGNIVVVVIEPVLDDALDVDVDIDNGGKDDTDTCAAAAAAAAANNGEMDTVKLSVDDDGDTGDDADDGDSGNPDDDGACDDGEVTPPTLEPSVPIIT